MDWNEIQKRLRHEDMIADLKKITLLTEKELVDFMESNKISYDDLRSFYLRFGRLPENNECEMINLGLLLYFK